jgi:DNA processing protein
MRMTGRDFVALSLLPSARRRAIHALSALTPRSLDAPDALELLVAFCEGDDGPAAEVATRLLEAADAALGKAAARGVRAVAVTDPEYPASLRSIADPPLVLWVAGRTEVFSVPAVAIVGSRAASHVSLDAAERLGHDLAAAGLAVSSGLARGCDAAAHRGALAAKGTTIAVLGCGADVVYPPEHRRLYECICDEGAVVAELPPGTPPLPMHFPQRNRIISGLSRAVVVVEATERSGSLITAACALEQGRDVLAVPGSIDNDRHRGCHALLRDGARLVEDAADVLDELGLAGGRVRRGREADDDPLLDLLANEDGDLDRLADRSGLDIATVLRRMLALELAGHVRRAPGGRFVRVRR